MNSSDGDVRRQECIDGRALLGLAMRARKVVMGDAVLKSIQNGQACLVHPRG